MTSLPLATLSDGTSPFPRPVTFVNLWYLLLRRNRVIFLPRGKIGRGGIIHVEMDGSLTSDSGPTGRTEEEWRGRTKQARRGMGAESDRGGGEGGTSGSGEQSVTLVVLSESCPQTVGGTYTDRVSGNLGNIH